MAAEQTSRLEARRPTSVYAPDRARQWQGRGLHHGFAPLLPLNDLATELDKKLSRNPSVPVVWIGWMAGTWLTEGQGSAALRNGSAAYSNIPESANEVLGKKHFTWRHNYKFFVPASQGPSRPAERCAATATWGYRVQ